MINSGGTIINITKLGQVCIAVRDLDNTMKSMLANFGIGPWNINIRYPDAMSNMTYHGKPARFGFKVARAQNKLGGMEIELIEPIEGENIFSDFLREHGDGIHHVGWYKVDSLAHMAKLYRNWKRQASPVL